MVVNISKKPPLKMDSYVMSQEKFVPKARPNWKLTSASPYDLRSAEKDSSLFYLTLHTFAHEVLNVFSTDFDSILHQYSYYAEEDCRAAPRSIGEYGVELLTLGITWQRYCKVSVESSRLIIAIQKMLFRIRRKSAVLKPCVDMVRGFLSGMFLVPKLREGGAHSDVPLTRDSFRELIDWLDATGEFKDEVKRFRVWDDFFGTVEPCEVGDILNAAIKLEMWFRVRAQEVLGEYTSNVDEFVKENYKKYRMREDELFCTKSPVEYHCNMVASHIMNTGLRDSFKATKRKVLLVPGCMKSLPDRACKARINGLDIRCGECDKECSVNKLSSMGKKIGLQVNIVPHSSSFTKWLKQWENSTDCGVIAVACPLNIVAGGYEMRELNIPSQCIMLDYCGCKKHWNDKGIPTEFNHSRLLELL